MRLSPLALAVPLAALVGAAAPPGTVLAQSQSPAQSPGQPPPALPLPAPPAESYLAVNRLVEAARRSRVDAVLPVPPALAGNAALAEAVVAADLTWVGPDTEVLERLGGDGAEPEASPGTPAGATRYEEPARVEG